MVAPLSVPPGGTIALLAEPTVNHVSDDRSGGYEVHIRLVSVASAPDRTP